MILDKLICTAWESREMENRIARKTFYELISMCTTILSKIGWIVWCIKIICKFKIKSKWSKKYW